MSTLHQSRASIGFCATLSKCNDEALRTVTQPKGFQVTGPNQVWSWDITFLASCIRGSFYRLYLVLDIFSRKIVGWEVHDNELAEHASVLIGKTCLVEGIREDGLVLHADNGGPMKGATMLATLQRLGLVPSFRRPSVSKASAPANAPDLRPCRQ